jgi:Ca2+-binding RTX toxin-like protein
LVGEAPTQQEVPDGNDTIYGDNGDDFVVGNFGNDKLSGGNGDDGINGDVSIRTPAIRRKTPTPTPTRARAAEVTTYCSSVRHNASGAARAATGVTLTRAPCSSGSS